MSVLSYTAVVFLSIASINGILISVYALTGAKSLKRFAGYVPKMLVRRNF